MRVLCAWCCRDGKPGYLGEREPLNNPEPTHGVCARHKTQLLQSLPSRSFPDADLLIVVRRDNVELYEKFTRVFAAVPRVKVILDRRVADRRVRAAPVASQGSVADEGPVRGNAVPPGEGAYERRRARRRRIRESAISSLGGFTIVRFTPRD